MRVDCNFLITGHLDLDRNGKSSRGGLVWSLAEPSYHQYNQ